MSDATEPADLGPSIRIVSGSPTAEELAAVTAVLANALEEAAAEQENEGSTQSAWDRSRATMRTPLHPGPGEWRGFSG